MQKRDVPMIADGETLPCIFCGEPVSTDRNYNFHRQAVFGGWDGVIARKSPGKVVAFHGCCGLPAEPPKLPEPPPVDRSAVATTRGTDPHAPKTIDPETGLQNDYVILSDEERAKGFVRPVRDTYEHAKCGLRTTLSRKLAETYARDPAFYSGTYCSSCRDHFPVGANGEFVWADTSEKVGT